jgi:phosphoenolpyruvate---glycerone phosphotransferase subunit DhaL
MALTADTLRLALARATEAARSSEDELNTADGKLGDGDTGVMLRRLFERLSAAAPQDQQDIGALFQALGSASASATGSSLGTLVTVAMLTLAKQTRGQTELRWGELGDHLRIVRDTMMSRGGAALGDKTVVDMIDAVAEAVVGVGSPEEIADCARRAAQRTLETFRGRPNRLGRARMFGNKSVGLDDPGMLAFFRLLDDVARSG